MSDHHVNIGDVPRAIYTRLRNGILSGEMVAGQQIKIQMIAEEMGVSIVPVREAIRMLAAEGLMELRPRRSPIVAPLELAELLEIANIRLAMEPFFLAMAVDAHTDETIEHCQQLIIKDEASTSFGEKVELNHAFHVALLEPSRQPRALKVIDDQFESIARFAQMMVMQGEEDLRGHVHIEHQDILNAVIARDTEKAVTLLEQHISSASKRIAAQLEHLGQTGGALGLNKSSG